MADDSLLAAHGTSAMEDLTVDSDGLDAADRTTSERSMFLRVAGVRIMYLSVASDVVIMVLEDSIACLARGENELALPLGLLVDRDLSAGEGHSRRHDAVDYE